MDIEEKYYVYVYLDTRKKGDFKYGEYHFDYEPFYVGKGKGRRYKRHLNKSNYNKTRTHKSNRIKFLIENGYEIKIIKVEENISENKSFELEIDLIKKIGRFDINSGPLCNHTDGGEGSSGGVRKNKGKTLEEVYGIVKAQIIKKKLSKSHELPNSKSKLVLRPRKKPKSNKGKTLDEIYGVVKAKELKKKIVKNLIPNKKGSKLSNETKKKISNSLIGKRGRNTGNKHSNETKNKISESKKGIVSWNAKPIIQLSKEGEKIKEWRSAKYAAEKLKLSQGNIWSVINGNRKTCGGFKWKLNE